MLVEALDVGMETGDLAGRRVAVGPVERGPLNQRDRPEHPFPRLVEEVRVLLHPRAQSRVHQLQQPGLHQQQISPNLAPIPPVQ